MACCLLHTRGTWWCLDVLRDGYEGRPACRNLPSQLHHRHADCDLPMDGVECWRANEAGDQCGSGIWKLQRRQYYRASNVPRSEVQKLFCRFHADGMTCSQGRTELYPSKDHSPRDPGSCCTDCSCALRVLRLGQQTQRRYTSSRGKHRYARS